MAFIKAFLVGMFLVCLLGSTEAQLLDYNSKDSVNGKPKIQTFLMGRIKLNGIYDINGNLFGNSAFLIHDNNVYGKDIPGVWMDMRQSQIRFQTVYRMADGTEITSKIEGDFEGGPDNKSTFRLRHAWVQWKHWMVGQNWSTFGDGGMWPQSMLDWDGPTGLLESRRPMVRYFGNLAENKFTYELAAEIMEPRRLYDYTANTAYGIDFAPKRMPDFVASLKYHLQPSKDGWVKLAGIYRNIGYNSINVSQGQTEASYQSANGYGVSLMTTLFWGKRNHDFQAQTTYGQGIADYFLPLGGYGLDGFARRDASGTLDLLPVWAGYVSYQHFFTDKFNVMTAFSWNQFFSDNAATAVTTDVGTTVYWSRMSNLYCSVNFQYKVYPQLWVTAEYLYGYKYLNLQDNLGSKGKEANRIAFGVMYNFN